MNLVTCCENCRWQNDGMCMLEDLSRGAAGSSKCRYYEEAPER